MTEVIEKSGEEICSPRNQARHLYWQGWRISSIARFLGVSRGTVQGWKDAGKWAEAQPIERVEGALESRLVQLIFSRH
jgi:uncharacterized protein YjcR